MEVLTTTPFGRRPVTAGLIERAKAARAKPVLTTVNKWDVLRDITTAKKTYGLNASALTVLNALLSFHRGDQLEDAAALVVFPSNRTLASRCHGMPDSTLRRNLALLVKSGLIARHDSPNGKRYAVRQSAGEISHAFGFDLRPMLVQAPEVANKAQGVRLHEAEIKRARERAGLLKRDCWKYLEFARAELPNAVTTKLEETLLTVQKHLRRLLSLEDIQSICDRLQDALSRFENLFNAREELPTETARTTEEMDSCDNQNERHIQSSNKDTLDSEKGGSAEQTQKDEPTTVPISVVLNACPEIQPYAPNGISQKHELVETAYFLHPMMGISQDVWIETVRSMGKESASITLACILQRASDIRNPAGYLRSLARKAEAGEFSVWPMLRALISKTPEVAS